MLKPPKVGGAGQLRLFVDQIGFDRSCKIIDVHPATMRAWLRESRPVPKAALMALYWLTDWGYSDACAEAHWSHQFTLSKMRGLDTRVERLRELVSLSWRTPVFDQDAGNPAKLLHVVGDHDPIVHHGDACNHAVTFANGQPLVG